ncbi:hypothetical protein Hypma_003351 [Hypsizygus marmoreus]|uniref:Uncharacterized protein n=1 Tax=Hypsizygus marmoreus TaxID=39966 RepID=A0A369J9L1_HYPMA|nr:hypothetical protein Hypma_003351 [Hypsizygus marmoreus]
MTADDDNTTMALVTKTAPATKHEGLSRAFYASGPPVPPASDLCPSTAPLIISHPLSAPAPGRRPTIVGCLGTGAGNLGMMQCCDTGIQAQNIVDPTD